MTRTFLLPVVLMTGAAFGQTTQRSIPGTAFTIDIDAAPMPNLTYQLDCLAQVMPCSTDAYRELWTQVLGWRDDDEKALESWSALRRKYQGSIRLRGGGRVDVGYPIGSNGLDVETRLRIAGFVATDIPSYGTHLGLLVLPADAVAAMQVLARFWPRFGPWWKTTASKQLAPFLQATASLFVRKSLLAFIEKVETFYEADLPRGLHLPLHLVLRPAYKDKHTNGQQLENHAVVEVVEGEKPEDRVDVIAHELFHYFFFSMPPARAEALLRQFIDADAPGSLAAFGLLNEALATALGNGLLARQVISKERFEARLKKPKALYDDAAIDATAKGLIAPLEKLLADGQSITSPAFVTAQLEAAQAAAGPGGFGPTDYLRTMLFLFDPEFGELRTKVRRTLRSASVWSSSPLSAAGSLETLKDSPLVSGVVLVSPKQLAHLAAWPELGGGQREKLEAAAKRDAAFTYVIKRGPKAWLWLLVAPDTTTMGSLLDALACAPPPREGVVPVTARNLDP